MMPVKSISGWPWVWFLANFFICLSASQADKVVSPHPSWDNLATGASAQFHPAPNYADVTDAEDAKQLVDGAFAIKAPIWYDRSTVGWTGPDPVQVTIDLGKVQPIRGVALHTGAGQSGVEWPDSIKICMSDSGDKFTPVGDLMQLMTERPPAKGYAALWLSTDKLETHGRFIKFICAPQNLGTGSYFFLDEVEVYRGPDELLSRPLAEVDAPRQWLASWRNINWNDNADSIAAGERPVRVKLIDGKSEQQPNTPLMQAELEGDAVVFTLEGEAGKPRMMSWKASLAKPLSTENCRYALLTFRAEGIRRTYEPQPLVLLEGFNAKSASATVPLLEANLPLNDGRSHTVLTRLPEGFVLQQFRVSVLTESDKPRLALERLELTNEPPDVFSDDVSKQTSPIDAGFVTAEIGPVLNGTLSTWHDQLLSKYGKVLDGARALKPGPTVVCGVPFVIASGEKNLAVMPESAPSSKKVEFLGAMVDDQVLEPASRDDSLSVDVDMRAREAFLLLGVSAPPVQSRYGIPGCPLRLDDIEVFSVELVYDHGKPELAFPYSLADKGCYIPARALGAYAVAVDPSRTLKKVTLHNRQYGPNFALAALTLNVSSKSIVPELVTGPPSELPKENPQPPTKPLRVTRQGTGLIFGNRWYECTIDLAHGFAIQKFVNHWNDSATFRLDPSSGLRVRVGDTIYTGRCFKGEIVSASNKGAELKLISTRPELPLEMKVTITADDSPSLAFVVEATNCGEKPLAAEISLPAVEGLAVNDVQQTRMFFPQYRAVDTAEHLAMRAPYGSEFSSQFVDVYSRPAGVGLMIRSSNMEQQMQSFALRKDDGGVSGGVCFPADYNELTAGASRTYIPVSLVAHGGDWREAIRLQRDWIRSWLKPHKSQDKDYFLNAWEVACYRPSNVISWQDTRTPPNINAERTKFLTEEIFAFEKKVHGHKPDLVHFFHWTYNDKEKHDEYGIFGTPRAYQQVGGIDFFRKGIEDMQTRLNTPLSLYTLVDRFRPSALPDQELAKDLMARAETKTLDTSDGTVLRGNGADGVYSVRCGDKQWTDFFIQDIVRMQRDTGCKMIYIDVFAYWSHLKGQNGTSPRQADLDVLKRLKELLPPDVAIWSEYSVTDFASQYEDGALVYYFLELHETFARPYNRSDRADSLFSDMPLNAGRYTLPNFKTFGLPAGIEGGNKPGQVDALFVNGEGIQEDTWRIHHSRIRQKLNRAYQLKHDYTDCFNSQNPVPHVDTAAAGIVANCFAGKNRTLWTLYNGQPRTYSGTVLAIPHQPGAKYRDAWNNQELQPTIENGMAKIAITLDPQQPGCVVQERN
jgi:hypothetical protein